MKNFIEIYDNAVPLNICEELIQHYNYINSSLTHYNRTYDRKTLEGVGKIKKDDKAYFFHEETDIDVQLCNTKLLLTINSILSECIREYFNTYDILENRNYVIWMHKIQHVNVGGGYHVWHEETSQLENKNRLLQIIIYLNDVNDGGETEFLYQSIRVKPQVGRILIAPAGFTHTHRGNPPLSNDKYIVTTWIENYN